MISQVFLVMKRNFLVFSMEFFGVVNENIRDSNPILLLKIYQKYKIKFILFPMFSCQHSSKFIPHANANYAIHAKM